MFSSSGRRRCWWRPNRSARRRWNCAGSGKCRPQPSTSRWRLSALPNCSGGSLRKQPVEKSAMGDTHVFFCVECFCYCALLIVTSLKCLVMRQMLGARIFLSGFIQAWHNSSLIGPNSKQKKRYDELMIQHHTKRGNCYTVTYSLLMENNIEWSRTVICSAISSAERVSMFSRLGTCTSHNENVINDRITQ